MIPRLATWTVLLLTATAPVSCTGGGRHAAFREEGPRRVVVLAPAGAEMLEALGVLERVVGIGEFGPWPDAIAGLPVVGGYDDPSPERVLELECDLLVTAASRAASPSHARLEALGVRVLSLDTRTFEGVFDSLAAVGDAFSRREEAQRLARSIRVRMDAIAARARDLPRRRVLFVVGRDPLYIAGPGSHVDRMISMAGGTNVVHDALTPYQQVSVETVIERLPEVIIDTSDNRPGAPRGRVSGPWGRWEFLPAVQENRVYWVEPGRLVIPGIRLPEMTDLMGKLIHPEVFGEPTPRDVGAAPRDDAVGGAG